MVHREVEQKKTGCDEENNKRGRAERECECRVKMSDPRRRQRNAKKDGRKARLIDRKRRGREFSEPPD